MECEVVNNTFVQTIKVDELSKNVGTEQRHGLRIMPQFGSLRIKYGPQI